MKILITGAGGQLGLALQHALSGHDLLPLDHARLDVTDSAAVHTAIAGARPDVVIHPFVSLEGRSVLREGCEVHSFTRVADSVLGPGVVVGPHCDIEGATIGARCRVGPFARLRPGLLHPSSATMRGT